MPPYFPSSPANPRRSLLSAIALLLIFVPQLPALTLHVNQAAAGSADGSDWTNAFTDLQSALAVASSGDDIWVATGTYYPDLGTGQANNQRSSTFTLLDGVSIYGGFSGNTPEFSKRHPQNFPTLLSGDLLQNDGTTGATLDNALHVLTGTGTNATALLDGFLITSGNANGDAPNNGGGGLICNGTSTPTIVNCSFSGNLASDLGAAVYNNDFAAPTFLNCAFAGNHVSFLGGAICNTNSSTPSFTNCSFAGNAATGLSGYGGAIYSSPSSSAALINSILWNNSATTDGDHIEGPVEPASSNNLVGGEPLGGHIIASTDPLFVRNPDPGPDGVWTGPLDNDYGDLQLQVTSPSIDIGLNSANTTLLDLANNSRLQNGIIDLGAFEEPFIQTVTNTNDSGPGSLRQLIANIVSPGGSTIIFDPSLDNQSITLSTTSLVIDKTLIIDGSALPTGVTIDANHLFRIFEITSGNTVTFDSFTITGGKTSERSPGANGADNPGGSGGDGQDGTASDDGGGILNSGILTLSGVTLTDNRTGNGGNGGNGGSGSTPGNGGKGGPSGNGGAIANVGTLNVFNTTIDNNQTGTGGNAGTGNGTADAGPGGSGAGIYNTGTLTILHGTITQNSIGSLGSGATPTQNPGGGVKQSGQLTLANTIIAQNSAPVPGADLHGAVTSTSGVNFIGNPAGASGLGPNLLSGDPLLGPLISNGGPTRTRRPTFDSPVVDPVNGDTTSTLDIDQRRLARIVTGIADIGSVEAFLSKIVTNNADSGPGSLRDALLVVANGGIITFDPSLNGGTILLSSGAINVVRSIIIDASPLPLGITIDANNASRVLTIDDGDDLTFREINLKNLTITGGNISGNGGGISNRENLHLLDCALHTNSATESGGSIQFAIGTSSMERCTVTNNTAAGTGGGGGIQIDSGASLDILDSSFTGNNATNTASSSLGGGSITALNASTLTITNSTFHQETSAEVGGSLSLHSDSATITDCSFTENSAEIGGAVHISSADPTFFSCDFIENQASDKGGAFAIEESSNPDIGNCSFLGNSADSGGAIAHDSSFSSFTNCAFSGNHSTSAGGAAYTAKSSSPTFTNCSFSGNHSDDGGGLFSASSPPTLTHCIFWANTATTANPQISGSPSAPSSANLIQGGSGSHVILTSNPVFYRTPNPGLDGLWSGLADNDYGNLRLVASSPALEAGSNAAYDAASSITTDLAGNPRKVATIDLGAYEGAYITFAFLFPALDPNADDNHNGLSNFVDYALGIDPTTPAIPGMYPVLSANQITFSFRAPLTADAVPVFERSPDIFNWQLMIEGVDYSINSSNTIGSRVELTLDLLPPSTSTRQHFFREGFVDAE